MASGIFGGSRLLITNNTVLGNQSGIAVGDFGTVTFNTSSGNSFFGVLAGKRSLITGNTTNGNGDAGIATGGLSSVSYNVSNGNGGGGIGVGVDGVFDGTQSLVTGNTTNDNGDRGRGLVSQHRDEQQIVGKPNFEQQLLQRIWDRSLRKTRRGARPRTTSRPYGASAAFLISSTSGAAWGLLAVPRIRMSCVETSLA